ncbi:MAG: M50 family metallopeptidase [Candidatus Aenigmarchaeota archaeon]|nr:M50 family metallopeptidase [Candidatus Aenigmarchaeota archaeon]
METRELRDIAVSAIALAFAFALANVGGIEGVNRLSYALVAAAFIAVSLSFICHELGHRFVARHFGCYAEYKMWKEGLALALLSSLFGFVFAAPGAVYVHPKTDLWGAGKAISRKRYGIISLAGPVVNLLFAGIFFALHLWNQSDVFLYGIAINIWLAVFNMIPLPPLDGSKIFAWDKRVWLAFFALCGLLLFWTTI